MTILRVNEEVADIISNVTSKLEEIDDIIVIRINKQKKAILSTTMTDANTSYIIDRVKFHLLCEASFKTDPKDTN